MNVTLLVIIYSVVLVVLGIGFLIWMWIEALKWSKPGTIFVEMLLPSGDSVSFRRRIKSIAVGDVARFSYKDKAYVFSRDTKYAHRVRKAFGLVTVMKLHYLLDSANPIDWTKLKIGDALTSERVQTALENHVASDALKQLAREVFSPMLMVVVICTVVAVSGYLVYRGLNGKITTIQDTLNNPPIVVETGGR